MKTYTESELARAIATVIVKSRTDEKSKNLAAGAKHVGKNLGVNSNEIRRITDDLMVCKTAKAV